MPDLSNVLPILSLLIAALALGRNWKSDTKQDQSSLTTVIVKLEAINDTVKEIRIEMRDLKADIDSIRERVVAVEQSVKSAHKRLDDISSSFPTE